MEEYKLPEQETYTTTTDGTAALPIEVNVWTKIKSFLLQEIKVQLTPEQQRFENKLNEILNREVTFKSIKDFLFQEIKF